MTSSQNQRRAVAKANQERAERARAAQAAQTAHHWAWPDRGACCWPTTDGPPWRFCGAPAGHGENYCQDHTAAARPAPGARGGTGTIAALDTSQLRPRVQPPGGFVLPTVTGDRSGTRTRAILNGAKSATARQGKGKAL